VTSTNQWTPSKQNGGVSSCGRIIRVRLLAYCLFHLPEVRRFCDAKFADLKVAVLNFNALKVKHVLFFLLIVLGVYYKKNNQK